MFIIFFFSTQLIYKFMFRLQYNLLANDPSEENNLIGTNSDIEEDLRKKLIEISQN